MLDKLLSKLRDLRRVVQDLDSFRFYTSSLLLTYDAATSCCSRGSPACLSPPGGGGGGGGGGEAADPCPPQARLNLSLNSYDMQVKES